MNTNSETLQLFLFFMCNFIHSLLLSIAGYKTNCYTLNVCCDTAACRAAVHGFGFYPVPHGTSTGTVSQEHHQRQVFASEHEKKNHCCSVL